MKNPRLACLLLLGACASDPTMERSTVPDRPEVQRPEGLEPEGLAEVRNTLAAQRMEARERENTLTLQPNALSTTTETPWYESVFGPFADLLEWLRAQ